MSKRGRDLTADEEKLWRRVAERVRSRRPAERGVVNEKLNSVPKTDRLKASKTASPPSTPSVQAGVAPPADRGAEKRVRRGKLEIGGTLDLHGHTQVSARAALSRFLQTARRRGDRTVLVITGVGRAGQGMLKQRLPEWLAESDLRALVSGFAQAHRAHGGAGAYYIFLKSAAR